MMRVDVKKLIQELVVPEIRQVLAEVQTLRVEIQRVDEKIDLVRSELKAEIEGLRKEMETRIDALRKEMDSMRREMETRFEALRKEMDSMRKEMETRIGALSQRIDVALDLRERIVKLESRVEALTGKTL